MTPKTMTMAGPIIKTALPGPNAKRVLEGDDRYEFVRGNILDQPVRLGNFA